IDYRKIETGLRAVIEENRVQHLPSGVGQAKGNIADSENRLDVRDLLLDQPHAFNCFNRAADVVFVPGGARKHKRIDDDVFNANTEIFGEKFDGTPRDFKLALAGYSLGLLLVFVDATDDQRSAVLARKGRYALEFVESIFEVNRVDDRLALAIGQRAFNGDRIGGIDHDRRLHHTNHLFIKSVDVVQLFAICVLKIHITDLRSAFYLLSSDLSRFLVFLFGDQALELA